jgi:cytoskeletal protein CcmA (bactofilin family)
MPIFRRDKEAAPAGAGAGTPTGETALGPRRGGPTFIAPGTKVTGQMTGATEIQVGGEVEGEVRVEALVVVGAGGAVLGPVHGQVVRVIGQVSGNVSAAERVEVAPGGSVEGDIAAPRVVIAEGAFFRGKIDMQGDKSRESRRPGKAGADAPHAGAAAPRAAAEGGSK